MIGPSAASRSTGKVVSINRGTKAAAGRNFNAQTTAPPGDGGDSWRASVESRLTELRTDMRHLLYAGIGAFLALAGAGWLVYKDATAQMRDIAVQQQNLAGKIDTMNAQIDGKIETLGERINDRMPPPANAPPGKQNQ